MLKLRRGPALMIFATLGFVLMVAFVKVARREMATHEVIAWRGLAALPIAWWFARGQRFKMQQERLFALRCLLGGVAMVCVFSAARQLAVADLSLIWRMQPLFVAVIAPIALGAAEKSGRKVMWAMAGGLLGCAVLLGPQLDGSGSLTWGLVALAGAGISGAAHVCLRRLNETESSAVIVFWFQLIVTVVAGAVCIFTSGTPFPLPRVELLPYLIGAGVSAAAGQLLMTKAYSYDKATVVAVAGYMGPVWAVIIDLVAFSQAPSWEIIVGGLIIVGASAALMFERKPS